MKKIENKIVLLLLAIIIMGYLINVNIKSQKTCQTAQVDMTQMLQYGESLRDIKSIDKNGRIFNSVNFKGKPVLFIFVKDDRERIYALIDSLQLHLQKYRQMGLTFFIVNHPASYAKANSLNSKETLIFDDTEELPIFKGFKVNNHGSCIILNRKLETVLSTLKVLRPEEVARIVHYKEKDIF
jgi:hypothetical protein